MIDILFCAHGRPEFTEASFHQLIRTLQPFKAAVRLMIYTDGDTSFQFRHNMAAAEDRFHTVYEMEKHGGPVACMNHYLRTHSREAEFFAKIDNDAIVPPGWLLECVAVMKKNPELAILGLEPPASRTVVGTPERIAEVHREAHVHWPELIGDHSCGYARTDTVGGIFFGRVIHFMGRALPIPSGTRGGFTAWQQSISKPSALNHSPMVIGWIVPPLKLFLLDRLPMEPWAGLSAKYESTGAQRPWTRYEPLREPELWGWWNAETKTEAETETA